MKGIKCFLYPLCIIIWFCSKAYCQNSLDSIKNDLININKVFDSTSFLSFKTTITLTSDTVAGAYENDIQLVDYKLNRKNIFYSTNDLEFMQDDSFVVTVYKSQHTIFLSRQSLKNSSQLFPLQGFTDSLISFYSQKYIITKAITDSSAIINFKSDSAGIFYNNIQIEYDTADLVVNRISLQFKEEVALDSSAALINGSSATFLQKSINILFTDYGFNADKDNFDYRNYVYYDIASKTFKGTGKYKGYQVIASNMQKETEYEDDDIQQLPPSVN